LLWDELGASDKEDDRDDCGGGDEGEGVAENDGIGMQEEIHRL